MDVDAAPRLAALVATKILLVNPNPIKSKGKKEKGHLPKGLRACMTCLKWVNGSDFLDKCHCGHPVYASSQRIGAAIVHARQDFPRARLKQFSLGERVEFIRALASLFRPYAPEVADAMESYDGLMTAGTPPDPDIDGTDR